MISNIEETFNEYIKSISEKFSHKETSEMGYRADFEILLKTVFGTIKVKRVDHDARTRDGNKPDFIIVKGEVPILYIEVKDIGISLDKVEKSDQMTRYFGYANLVLTDYLEFRFYRNGVRYNEPIKIGEYNSKDRTIISKKDNFELAGKTLIEFTQSYKEPIKNGEHLAKIMGGKARRIRDNVNIFLLLDNKQEKNEELMRVYQTIKEMLVHDLTFNSFADMYAQTLVYGLFVARYYDESVDTFSRQEARDLVPASNPFLQHFFDHIAGPNFDKRLSYIVDELCEVFEHANTKRLVEVYMNDADPIIHFYEDFLKEYDPELRKRMGAYYTPLPVVNFIVRSVDTILRKDFGLSQGLADTTKLPDGEHKVQILDPAVGTGTFISQTIDEIYKSFEKSSQKGRWPSYVHHDLLPRLYGFELMMSPYTIAHLKISLKLKDTGFLYFNETRAGKTRLKVYLTNSLENTVKGQDLFAFDFGAAIAEESKQAAIVKNETPIMVVIGNPPYSVSSSNKGQWIQEQIKVYKEGLGERKINLDDDYIKFLRFAEYFIEKNKTGVIAMITNNSFIDGITHRQMRRHLLKTFDDIYILDLHGNSKKKEKAPDGGKDENVFDIQQGVSINIFVRKTQNKENLGVVYHAELYGKREEKFNTLDKSSIDNVEWENLNYTEPYYFFVPKDFSKNTEYDKGFKIDEIFLISNSGVKTDRDSLFIDMKKQTLETRLQKLLSGDYDEKFRSDFRVIDSGSYKLTEKIKHKVFNESFLKPIQYRPFDYQWIYYDPKLISRPADKVLTHLVDKQNVALITSRQFGGGEYFICFSTKVASEISSQPFAPYTLFPLYLYTDNSRKIPNFNKEIVSEIEKITGEVSPDNIFDYIYAVLHSPSYREKYKEFLKIDFPRVPYPKDKKQFDALVAIGTELRKIHLLESPQVSQFITTYPISGSDTVEKITYKNGNTYINAEQYFGDVPDVAWDFYIGGYQPAQKWLKDRKGRTLSNSDIEHYQKIIVALTETDRLMQEIDKIDL